MKLDGVRQITVSRQPRNGFHADRHRFRSLSGPLGCRLSTARSTIYPYILRKVPKMRSSRAWCSNIKYIPVRRGYLYLGAIRGRSTRRVLTWRLSNTLNASCCAKELKEAITKYGKLEIMKIDQRSLYAGTAWSTTLTEAGIKHRWMAEAVSRLNLHRTTAAFPQT